MKSQFHSPSLKWKSAQMTQARKNFPVIPDPQR